MLGAYTSTLSIVPQMGVLLLVFAILLDKTLPQYTEHDGRTFFDPPSLSEMVKAVALHAKFQEIATKSDAVFVLGSDFPSSNVLNDQALLSSADDFSIIHLPSFGVFDNHKKFAEHIKTEPIGRLLSTGEGFTAFCLNGKKTISALLCLKITQTEKATLYATDLFFGPGLKEHLFYSVYFLSDSTGWEIGPGVTHIYLENTNLGEVGTLISLPDPCLTLSASKENFNRFTFFENAIR